MTGAAAAASAVLRDAAPGKVNLALCLGPVRPDGLHALVSLVQALSLADAVALGPAGRADGDDEISCPGVEGPNLAAAALRAYREASGWSGPPQRITIDKRVPVAAGMGGGSSDAAAVLRLAARAAGRPDDPRLAAIAPGLGADVPALLAPGLALVGGAGEEVQPLPPLAPFRALVLPSAVRLPTAAVFQEADRLGLGRDAGALAECREALAAAVRPGGPLPLPLLRNDLEPAARSLCPEIGDALAAARTAGAAAAMVSGSGPTVVGFFPGGAPGLEAEAAALAARFPGATVAAPVAGDGAGPEGAGAEASP